MGLCCNAAQARGMVQQFSIVKSIIGRCPACLHNFKHALCHLACSPGGYSVAAQQTIVRAHARMLAAQLRCRTERIAHPLHTRFQIGGRHNQMIKCYGRFQEFILSRQAS